MKEKIFKYKKAILIVSVIIIIFCISIYLDNSNENLKTVKKEKQKSVVIEVTTTKQEERYFIDIKGAVKNPGVYEVNSNYRIIDAINIAGGLSKYADTSVLNLGKKIKDQMVIIIYTKAEISNFKKKNEVITTSSDCSSSECICPDTINDACITTSTPSTNSTTTISGKVSINTANIAQLQTLTGIGETKAQAIIDYRIKNGDFKKIDDLLNVSGIGAATYDKIKENITL